MALELRHDKAALGLGHMHALVSFCREHGQQKQFELDDGAGRLTVLRAK